jgi:D-tyrosyl-tRNA(Tyr) deacylase
MRVVVQLSGKANCSVDHKPYSEIPNGLFVLVGFTEGDNEETIKWMVNKIVNLRIFPDENDIPNLSVLDVKGEILSVSQFTLYAECNKGNRPSYIKALGGEKATHLYDKFNEELSKHLPVKTGVFGSHMEITFTNIGPHTIIIEK